MSPATDVKNLEHISPNLEDWPINRFAQDRDEFEQRLIDYTLKRLLASSNSKSRKQNHLQMLMMRNT